MINVIRFFDFITLILKISMVNMHLNIFLKIYAYAYIFFI
jgi:hypothetical protein